MATEKENNNYVMCLNDMGGGVMNVSVKVCNTLRAQSHNHEPVVVFSEDDNTDKFKAVTEVGGVDVYNLTMTGDKAKTLTASREDNEHIPCVLIKFIPHPYKD